MSAANVHLTFNDAVHRGFDKGVGKRPEHMAVAARKALHMLILIKRFYKFHNFLLFGCI
jgi:hypothetical protein